MDIITSSEFNDICNNINTIIVKFGRINQPKVFEKDGKTIIKLFYPKQKWLSSDRLNPRALRFYKNIQSLHQQGYDVPRIIKIQYCSDLKIYLVYYDKIEGDDVRKLVNQGALDLLHSVAELVAGLHQNGIFFRSIHLENLLYKPDGTFALLDITDVRFKSRPLTLHLRYRNLKHLLLERNDKEIWQKFGVDNFLAAYFRHVTLPPASRERLSRMIYRAIK
ncbi:hypothetical protein AQUSIP_01080 [Aquicella siphonis]|uniref:3-deoxy-D-manno-octulosonic acid kinase n=1 Tax=Aquicella siphonis TaxID=254247 RepID=A0A5E4PES7_9COXI|nr:hypothetical protein [Aquicella siphonis]VVC74836.1 hypothetical protein AQUSIP_01080 [Aquicella siphonis]